MLLYLILVLIALAMPITVDIHVNGQKNILNRSYRELSPILKSALSKSRILGKIANSIESMNINWLFLILLAVIFFTFMIFILGVAYTAIFGLFFWLLSAIFSFAAYLLIF